MELQLRIHQEKISADVLGTFLKDYCDRWYLVLEADASRSHYQAYLQVKAKYKSVNSFRNLVKKLVSGGNRAYSISELRETPIVLICYLMKEGNVVSQKGITAQEISQAEARQQEIIEARQSREKKKIVSIVAQIMEVLPSRRLSRQEMSMYVLRWFLDRKKLVPDQSLFKRYLYTIELQRDPAQAVEYLRTCFEYDSSPPTLELQAKWSEFFSQETVS